MGLECLISKHLNRSTKRVNAEATTLILLLQGPLALQLCKSCAQEARGLLDCSSTPCSAGACDRSVPLNPKHPKTPSPGSNKWSCPKFEIVFALLEKADVSLTNMEHHGTPKEAPIHHCHVSVALNPKP